MQYSPKTVSVQDLVENPWNSNKMSPENEAKLDQSIMRFGMYKPIIVRKVGKKFEIIGGAHRFQSAKRLGMEEVPVIDLGEVDDKKAKEIGLVDNGRYGSDDAMALSEILRDIGKDEDISAFLPYTSKEIESIFAASEINFDTLDIQDDEVPIGMESSSGGPAYQIMRFKVTVEDAEAISLLIEKVQMANGLDKSDALTNAGDALVHILLRNKNE